MNRQHPIWIIFPPKKKVGIGALAEKDVFKGKGKSCQTVIGNRETHVNEPVESRIPEKIFPDQSRRQEADKSPPLGVVPAFVPNEGLLFDSPAGKKFLQQKGPRLPDEERQLTEITFPSPLIDHSFVHHLCMVIPIRPGFIRQGCS